MNIASYSIQTSLARIAWLSLAYIELYNVEYIYSASFIVTFVCFICLLIKILYAEIRLMVAIHLSITQFERTPYTIWSHLFDSGLSK